MKTLLVFVFGLVGLAVVLTGGFLMLKDGGLACDLYERDAAIQQAVNPSGVFREWTAEVENIAAKPASEDVVSVPNIVDDVRRRLPEPRDAARAVGEAVDSVHDRVTGGGTKKETEQPAGE